MADGLRLAVRLTPRAGQDAIEGISATPDGPVLAARVRGIPADGAANAALMRLIADWLDLRKRDISLVAGHKSRLKTVKISGDPAALDALLRVRLGL